MADAIRASSCQSVIDFVQRLLLPAIAWSVCFRAILVLAPTLSIALWTGRSIYLGTALGVTGLIVVERVSRSAVLLSLHALVTAGLFLLFLVALSYPLIFIVLCAACGFTSVAIGRFGEHLISLGSYSLIPALYLACEIGSKGNPVEVGTNALAVLQAWPLAVASVGTVAVIGYRLVTRLPPPPLTVSGIFRLSNPPASTTAIEKRALCRLLAVLAAAALTEIGGVSEPQWVIWSAASVALGDPAGSWDKARVRGRAVLIGVPLGLLAGWPLPSDRFTYSVLAILIALSLIAVPNYALSVAMRAALVAAAGRAASNGIEIGMDRVCNLLLGGLIGYVATAGLNGWWLWRQQHWSTLGAPAGGRSARGSPERQTRIGGQFSQDYQLKSP
jgi:hypothetical protein